MSRGETIFDAFHRCPQCREFVRSGHLCEDHEKKVTPLSDSESYLVGKLYEVTKGWDVAEKERDSLKSRLEVAEKALERYARKDMWFKCVPDSYTGEVQYFDWENVPHDYENAWEIAEEALTRLRADGNGSQEVKVEIARLERRYGITTAQFLELLKKGEQETVVEDTDGCAWASLVDMLRADGGGSGEERS